MVPNPSAATLLTSLTLVLQRIKILHKNPSNALVQFENPQQATMAIQNLHGRQERALYWQPLPYYAAPALLRCR